MKLYQRVYGVLCWDDADVSDTMNRKETSAVLPKSHKKAVVRSTSVGSIHSTESTISRLNAESHQIELVRRRCQSQNKALAVWWKSAIYQTYNIQQRLLGQNPAVSELLPRYDKKSQQSDKTILARRSK